MNLSRKTIVVTGASSGIGAEVVRLARFHGATVVGLDRNDPMLSLDGFVKADLSRPDAIDAAVRELPERFDALVNAAGVPGTVDRDIVARVNYLGLRHLTEAVLDRMPAGGSIVNFASILGGEWAARRDAHKQLAATVGFAAGLDWLAANPVPQETCYQFFKEALIVWTFQRSHELFMQRELRMNCVAPGPVFTPILGDFVTMLGRERVEADAGRMKRPAYGDEIAPAVLFLCSDAARWINGVNLPIDGGLAATYV
ncbi:MAG TPA: coniferyl-alcohol dehydrogenase [Rhizobiales bacterium]|nr:coniferyl-alcohol dehydrogenase [Hyphomicrobiales bacterium]